MNRRGFLGTLFGAALAGIVGPLAIHGPSQSIWKAAPSLPLNPRTNEFVTLQQMVTRAIEIVGQETEWLKLHRVHEPRSVRDWERFGPHMVAVRQPVRLTSLTLGYPQVAESFVRVAITQQVSAEIKYEPDEIRGRTLPEFSKRHLEPAAYALAENVIRSIRAHGGGEYMVTVDQNVDIAGVPRAAMVRGEAEQIAIRGIHIPPSPPSPYGSHRLIGEQIVRLDMLFGVG